MTPDQIFSDHSAHFDATAAMLIAFRITALLVGAFLLYLGYGLFKVGYFEKAGELVGAWGKNELILKQVAPGIFFALFGTVIVCLGIWKPISIQSADVTPPQVLAALNKIVASQQLTEPERTVVSSWLEQRREPSSRYLALDPFSLSRKGDI